MLLEKERLERYVRNARFAVEKFDLFQQVAFDFNRFFSLGLHRSEEGH